MMTSLQSLALAGQSRWLAAITTVACFSIAPSSPAQVAPAAHADLGAREIDVLRDVMAQQWPAFKGPDGQLCLDPTVAFYRASASTTRERWSTNVLSKIAGDARISLDTLTAELPRGIRGCTRSQKTWRLVYGRPRVVGDSAAIVFIGTRLDTRGEVDSSKFDFRLERKAGKWSVEGWLAYSETVHRYVKGEGCYRLWYAPLAAPPANRTRIDTTEVRAESILVGQSWRTLPAYRLSTGPRSLGVAARPWPHSMWYVTHDSVHFQWSGGFEAILADLLVAGDTLRGTMHLESDSVDPSPPATSIRGRRIPCGLPQGLETGAD
jgi:hypothetical protein